MAMELIWGGAYVKGPIYHMTCCRHLIKHCVYKNILLYFSFTHFGHTGQMIALDTRKTSLSLYLLRSVGSRS